MITAALNGELENVDFKEHAVFGLKMPATCPNVPNELLFPKNTWDNKEAYDTKANELANAFNANFVQFADNASDEILAAAPKAVVNA